MSDEGVKRALLSHRREIAKTMLPAFVLSLRPVPDCLSAPVSSISLDGILARTASPRRRTRCGLTCALPCQEEDPTMLEPRFQELMQAARQHQNLYFGTLAAAAYAVFRADPRRWEEQYNAFRKTLSPPPQKN